MIFKPHRPLQLLLAAVLLFQVPLASAIGLLLPAVQAARESATSEPLITDIDGLGQFEVTANGGLPILSFDLGSAPFDTWDDSGRAFPVEILSLDLSSSAPLAIGSRFFDAVIELYPPDPVIPGEMTILTTSESPNGSSAKGELKGAFNFIVEIELIDIDDPTIIETFLHAGMIELNGTWHSDGRQLVFDDHLKVSGTLEGTLSPVPLPAGLVLMMTGLMGIAATSRWLKSRS